MISQKNTIYFVIIIVFAVLAVVGWLVVRENPDMGISPIEKQSPGAAKKTGPITILEPVPEGNPADHSASGWKIIKGVVPVKLQATDQVNKVVFYLDRTIVGEKISPPFYFELDTAKYKDCMYLLRAKAYDGAGQELGEDRSQIWIDNSPSDNC